MDMRISLFFILVAWCASARIARADETDELFQTHRLWNVNLRVTAERWEMMQPTRGTRLAFLLGTPRCQLPATRPADRLMVSDEQAEGYRMAPVAAGMEYAYVRAVAEFDDQVLKDVGLRFKGNASYIWTAWLRRAMKLDFNRFREGRTFMGVSALNLHNEAVDPSFLRDALGFMMYRDAGISSARTTFALLHLTIEGQVDRQVLGLYTLVEDVDKRFLKEHFGTGEGLLLKPDGIRNLPYLGENWSEYGRYGPKTEGSAELKQRVIDLTRLIHHADEATFAGSIESFMDVDETLKFVAVCTLLSDLDSFLTASHNFFMYVHPESKKIHFLPWDMNLGFGGVASAQAPEHVVHMSVKQPAPSNRLVMRLLAIPAYREKFEGHLRKAVATYFKPERVHAEIDRLQAVVRQAEAAERQSPSTMPTRLVRPMPDLKTFVTQRAQSVVGQLDGTVHAFGQTPPKPPTTAPAVRPAPVVSRPVQATPTTRPVLLNQATTRATTPRAPLPPKPPPPPPRRKTPTPLAPALLRAVDGDRDGQAANREIVDLVRVFFVMVAGPRASSIHADAVAIHLDRAVDILDTARVAPLGNPATQPSAPSAAWADVIVKQVDADGDGRLSIDEAVRAAQTWFDQSDQDRNGMLSSQELGDGLDRLAPR
jgi:spore coat protein CotH